MSLCFFPRIINTMADYEGNDPGQDTNVLEEIENELKEPDMFLVFLHNDHFTTMDFVVNVLENVFHKTVIEATKIMMDVHKKGKGVVGAFTYDIATTKVAQVLEMAREAEFPLRCTIEQA